MYILTLNQNKHFCIGFFTSIKEYNFTIRSIQYKYLLIIYHFMQAFQINNYLIEKQKLLKQTNVQKEQQHLDLGRKTPLTQFTDI